LRNKSGGTDQEAAMEFEFPAVDDPAERERIEAGIDACVKRFYADGLKDDLLGPIFGRIEHLDAHLDIVKNFWSRALLRTTRYEGLPFSVHIGMPIEPEHFARWVELFTVSARATLPLTQAEQAVAKATHMAQCFQGGLFPFTGPDGKPSRHPPV
jgi:hemoglobin